LLKANGGTLRAIADQLNQSGYCTRRGKAFHPMGVQRLLAKLHNHRMDALDNA